ncbi:BMP and activin membrane-bound inhibitor homolog isoform X1 [Lethenteron reissneri]|uniref:BMP and activin membrane-bound inhibitor homolog isoform X1 n=1 Tax=Lethenteron reissneri TaxID=7753 RepID=UPI002AB75A06|nr:BMP and activin membrane-bound inhibitor homolog isoform X1 [Lethenteron reissneri]
MERLLGFCYVWLHLDVFTLLLAATKGEIRCYCDAAHCVPTGYMCKSEMSVCFRRLLEPTDPRSPLAHGCIEALSPSPPHPCHAPRPRNHTGRWPVVRCCQDDMCNYNALSDRLPALPARADTPAAEHAPRGAGGPGRGAGGLPAAWPPSDANGSRELWFRAAVIAVPVAGALALALLVVLALRMLRSESRCRRRDAGARRRLPYSWPHREPPGEGRRRRCCCPACERLGCVRPVRRPPPAWPSLAPSWGHVYGGQKTDGGAGGASCVRKPMPWSLGRWGSSGSANEKVAFV